MSEREMTTDQRKMRQQQKEIERRLRLMEMRLGIFHPSTKIQLPEKAGRQ
jgi:hypothetical protein